mgnify:CR=1 FL=1|tara:strand:+ start:4289 stop:4612 length:324 start_codon:yes stop_codon:yes gene_type:complete
MRKLIITILFMSVSVVTLAQNKPAKKAQKITDEMTEVLDLNKKESKAVYQVQLKRLNEGKSIKSQYSDQPEVRKEKLRLLGNRVYNDLKAVIGIERLKQWKNYRKNK